MRSVVILAVVLTHSELVVAQEQSPKQRFLALNPGYKERATAFYVKEYLPGAVRSMTEAIRSPGFRAADADRVLRSLMGDFLDQWIEVGGNFPESVREEVIASVDARVQKLVKDETAFQRYLAWRHPSNSANNPLAFLMPQGDSRAADVPQAKKIRPIRVLVVDGSPEKSAIAQRLRKLKFDVVAVAWDKIDPDRTENIDVILLAGHWGEHLVLPKLEGKKDAFHKFVQRGGGLVASQPNPAAKTTCTPTLLPFPITFNNSYNDKDKTRVNFDQSHFITEDLPDHNMPFPHDRMAEVDPRYRILAGQKSTGSPSLVVCPFGDGRVVVQTNNETTAANIRLGDEILRRMLVWAAFREPRAEKR